MQSRACRSLTLALLLVLGASFPGAARAGAVEDRTRADAPVTKGRSIAEAVNPDGSLRLGEGLTGTFDPTGWRMVSGPAGEPRFVPVDRKAEGDDRWSDVFSSPGTDDIIRAVAVRGTDVFIGGSFAAIGKASVNNVARWDGDSWESLGDGVDGTVYSITATADALYVGGTFRRAGEVEASNIARWDGVAWSSLGEGGSNGVGGFFPLVYAIVVDGTEVFVGGSFTEAGGQPAGGIARWNAATGAWSEVGGGVRNSDPEDPAYVFALALRGQNLYAGGKFERAGTKAARNIARFQRAKQKWAALGQGTNDWVTAIALDGKTVYVGGFFTEAGGREARYVASFRAKKWRPLASGLASSETGEPGNVRVKGIVVLDGEVYVAGYFSHAGGVETNSVAKWTGRSWEALAGGLKAGQVIPFSGDVFAAAAGAGEVVVAGNFNQAGGEATYHVARWSVGTNGWEALADAGEHHGAYEGFVDTIAIDGTDVYVGGGPMTLGGLLAFGIAKWDGAAWSTLGEGATQGIDGLVFAITILPGGGLVAGGFFGRAGDVFTRNIARWDGERWHALGTGIGGSANAQVRAIAVDEDEIYAGGLFSEADGEAVNNIAHWNGTRWEPMGEGETNGVNGEAVFAIAAGNGRVYAGGSFFEAGGVSASNVAVWNGQTWSPLAEGSIEGIDGPVFALALDGDRLYVGGDFYSAAGENATNIAVFENGNWSTFGDGLVGSPEDFDYVLSLTVSGGKLYVAGYFVTADGTAASNVAVWDGQTWSPLGSGTNSSAHGIVAGPNAVFVVGAFARAGGKPSVRVARWATAE